MDKFLIPLKQLLDSVYRVSDSIEGFNVGIKDIGYENLELSMREMARIDFIDYALRIMSISDTILDVHVESFNYLFDHSLNQIEIREYISRNKVVWDKNLIPLPFHVFCLWQIEFGSYVDLKDIGSWWEVYIIVLDKLSIVFCEPMMEPPKRKIQISYVNNKKNMLRFYAEKMMNVDNIYPKWDKDSELCLIDSFVNNTSKEEKTSLEIIKVLEDFYEDIIDLNRIISVEIINDSKGAWYYPDEFIRHVLREMYTINDINYKRAQKIKTPITRILGTLYNYGLEKDFNPYELFESSLMEVLEKIHSLRCHVAEISDAWEHANNIMFDQYKNKVENSFDNAEGLPFGVLTNSFIGGALYILQDTMTQYDNAKKIEAAAEKQYIQASSENDRNYYRTVLQENKRLMPYFEQLLREAIIEMERITVEFLGIEYVPLLEKYVNIRKEINRTREKQRLESEKKQREEEQVRQEKRRLKKEMLNKEIEDIGFKLNEYNKELENLGLAIFGAKAKRKKEVQQAIKNLEYLLNSKKMELTD